MEFQVDGASVHAHDGGRPFDPAGKVVVLVHGAAMNHLAFALQTRWLAHRGFSVLALDLPACGRSGGEPAGSIGAAAAWLWRAMDALGVERAAIAGHSMGALIGLQAAALAPQRTTHLGLLGVGYPMAVNDGFLDAARDDLPLAIALMNDWAHARRSHFGGCQLTGVWMVGADTRVVEAARPGLLHHHLSICNAWTGGEAAARAVTCPTAMILGGADAMTPLKSAMKLKGWIAGAEARIVDGCGHMMMLEAPEAVKQGLATLLAR